MVSGARRRASRRPDKDDQVLFNVREVGGANLSRQQDVQRSNKEEEVLVVHRREEILEDHRGKQQEPVSILCSWVRVKG